VILVRDGTRLLTLRLWWSDAGMVEGVFSVEVLEDGE
jgi:hypothetical protein